MTNAVPGIGRRLASMLYESLVVFAVLLIGFLLPQILLSGFGLVMAGRLLWLHVLLLLMVYFVWFWLNGGQTLPMKTWKLRLVGADGRRPRPLEALLRYLAAWPSILLCGFGLFWALFDKDRQFLHDRIAATSMFSAQGKFVRRLSAARPTTASRWLPAGTRPRALPRWQKAATS